jgi:BirA family biotin operon repressor/biotin-[acetyl-CoA-carboxylase] ligase
VGTTLSPDRVEPLLRGRFGRPYTYRESCETTQELVRGLPEGAVAVADEQTAGRGRRGRGWASPPGAGLLFSLSLRPRAPADQLAPLSLVLADAVAAACGPDAAVRWPNDVVIGGRKLAGVLPELRDGQVIAGIGINANLRAEDVPPGARVAPTSLLIERGAPMDRAQLLADVLAQIEPRYDRFEREGFTGGRMVTLAGGRSGRCAGTAADGRLVVDGVAHSSGEVERVDVEADAASV